MTIVPRKIDPHYRWWVKTPASGLAVSLAEVKTFARIDTDAENNLLTTMIGAVTEITEKFLGRALLEQTMILSFDQWPDNGIIELPRPPLVELIEVRSLDQDGATTEYASTNYMIRADVVPPEIILRDSCNSTDNVDRYTGGWEIEYKAGYGEASDVPNGIKAGIMAWVASYYDSRVLEDLPPAGAIRILEHYKIHRF